MSRNLPRLSNFLKPVQAQAPAQAPAQVPQPTAAPAPARPFPERTQTVQLTKDFQVTKYRVTFEAKEGDYIKLVPLKGGMVHIHLSEYKSVIIHHSQIQGYY